MTTGSRYKTGRKKYEPDAPATGSQDKVLAVKELFTETWKDWEIIDQASLSVQAEESPMPSARLIAFAIALSWVAGIQYACAQSYSSPVTINAAIGSRALAAGLNLNMSGVGSGTNGPETAQFGTDMQCLKNNYYTPSATVPGNLYCFNVNVQQGGPNSDARGIVVNVQNTGQGFANGFETAATIAVSPNFSVPLYVDDQLADVTSDGGMAGAVFNSSIGTGQAGILVNTQGTASWKNLLQATKNGKVYFTITGSGNIVTSGRVTTAGLVTTKLIQAASFPVSPTSKSKVFNQTDCGTTIRSLGNDPVALVVPRGLPVGCQIEVIQASAGTVTFQGSGMRSEHIGTPDHWQVKTDGPGAQAKLLVDTAMTFFVTGDVSTARSNALALASVVRFSGEDASFIQH